MRPHAALALVVLGAVSLGAGWWLGPHSVAAWQTATGAGQLAFPDLAQRLQSAAKVEVTAKGKTMVVARKDGPSGPYWGLEDKGGYPVQPEKLRGILTGLTELRLVEPRTSDPKQFERLGLGDPNSADSTAVLLRVMDAQDKPVAALVLGHRRVRTGGNVPEEIYVRRPDDDRTWLAEGRLAVDADPALWLDRDIANIDHAKVADIVVTRGDQRLEFAQKDGKPALVAPADHPPLDEYKVEDVFRALETLTFTDVRPGPDLPGKPVGHADFRTTDGMGIGVDVSRDGAAVWARFVASGGDAAKGLEARVKGWAYQLGEWKEKALVPALDDLKAAPPAAAAPAAGTPAPASAEATRPPAVPAPTTETPPAPDAAPTAAPAHP